MSAVTPALASVVVVLIGDFARRPVLEQDRLKARVDDLVARALQPLPSGGRIMLDAPQGVAVALLDDPGFALQLAEQLQSDRGDLPLCIGINHGPVAIFEDANRGKGLVGDGIATGIILAEVAAPGRLIASRAFRDALFADAPAGAARLSRTGKHTDSQVRTHELYTLDHQAAGTRRLRFAIIGVVAFAVIIGLGVTARMALRSGGPPAVVELRVTPRGDIYVDGVLKGRSPPLTRFEVAAGRHTIEIRNDPHPPLKVEINPGRAEKITLAHAFGSASAQGGDKTLGESVREGWRSFRKSAGF